MPRPSSGHSNQESFSADPDFGSPTFSPPAEYSESNHLRPGTPGTIGKYSVSDSLNTEKYDYPPSRDTPTPSPSTQGLLYADGSTRGVRSSTYYFDKEAAATKPQPSYQNAGRRGPGYSAAVPAAALLGAKQAGVAPGGRKGFLGLIARHPWYSGLLLLLILAAIGVGAGVGVSQSSGSDRSDKNLSTAPGGDHSSGDASNGNSHSGGATGNGTAGSGASGSNTTESKPIVPLPRWNWTDPNAKVNGVSLGSWLLLERWQLEDWMVSEGGSEAWDEYRFLQSLGNRAADVLGDHQNTWVVESDMDTLQQAGINLIRIPIGFWAFIPTEGDEPYLTTGYVDQLNKMLQWCYDRKMYVMMDLHGMPGSQNGDQSSGHNTSDVLWFEQHQQDRSDAFVEAVLDWYKGSNYSSVISSIGIVNEPRVVNDNWTLNQTKFDVTLDFYERSYQTCLRYGIPMTFHHGFVPGSVTDKFNAWRSFATGKDPNYLIYEDHPYPGWFVEPLPTADQIQSSVCEQGQAAVGYPIPVIIGEYSDISNVNSTAFNKAYMNMQLSTYGWSAGSIFWNFKIQMSKLQILAQPDNFARLFSFLDLYGDGTITSPSSGQTVKQWLQALDSTCGSFQTFGWSNPSKTGASFQKRELEDGGASLSKRTIFKRDEN